MKELHITEKLYTGDIPVVLCDKNFYVVDSNLAAKKALGEKIIFKSFEKHLSEEDLQKAKSILFFTENSINNTALQTYHQICPVKKLRAFTVSLIILRKYFGVCFFEIRLFKNRAAMLENHSVKEAVHPLVAYKPMYEMPGSRAVAEKNAGELAAVFENNMLANLWDEANRITEKVCFDMIALSRHLTVDLSKHLRFIDSSFSYSAIGENAPVTADCTVSDFIHLYTLLMYLSSRISKEGVTKISAGEKGGTQIVFRLKSRKSHISVVGKCSFALLGELFPESSSLVRIITYLSEAYGISCFADFEKDGSLTLTVSFAQSNESFEFAVMHPEKDFYERMLGDALSLCDLVEKATAENSSTEA